MNIILYNPLGATKGHAQEYVDNICSGLVENGAKVALVTIDSYKIEDENIRHKVSTYTFKGNSNEVHSNRSSVINNLRYALWLIGATTFSLLSLIRGIRSERPSSCLFIGGSSLVNSFFLPFLKLFFPKIKFALTLHNVDFDWKLHRGNVLKQAYKLMQLYATKLLCTMNIYIFTHGELMVNKTIKYLGSCKDKVGYYPVPTTSSAHFNPSNCKSKKVQPIILFFGVIRHDKGLDILTNALKQVLDLDWKLVIAGSCEQVGEEYVAECISILPKERVEMDLKYFSNYDRDEYFCNCSIVCLPYRRSFQAQSVVMVDAMRFHKPVIATLESQNGYNTKKYKTGWVFESENIPQLVEVLKKALAYDNFLSSDGYKQFNSDHQPKKVAEKIMKMI